MVTKLQAGHVYLQSPVLGKRVELDFFEGAGTTFSGARELLWSWGGGGKRLPGSKVAPTQS